MDELALGTHLRGLGLPRPRALALIHPSMWKATSPKLAKGPESVLLIRPLGYIALCRSPQLAEVAATAAILASEKAGAISGTFVNVTSGTFPS